MQGNLYLLIDRTGISSHSVRFAILKLSARNQYLSVCQQNQHLTRRIGTVSNPTKFKELR